MSNIKSLAPKSNHFFGWKPSLSDKRDWLYSAPFHSIGKLPKEVDLRKTGFVQPRRDQGRLGSCTANAVASCHYFSQAKQGQKPFNPSRLGIYWMERDIEGTVNYDSGAYGRDGFKAIQKNGIWPEEMQPYNISNFKKKPSADCYKEGLRHQGLQYFVVSKNLEQLQGCLAEGFPFAFGFTVYDSFESATVARTGIMPLPRHGESVLGGHEVYAIGYKFINNMLYFICANSWNTSWGDKGDFYMPASFMTGRDCSDYNTLRLVE